jgi:hypothetical protein
MFNLNIMNLKKTIIFSCAIISVLFFASCKKDKTEPENPFDKIDRTGSTPSETNLDPNTIQGIHKNILSVKCANPGCHDGHFEPDFRTIQSSYATLVWNKVVKNNATQSYIYKVNPGDHLKSWLYERLVTNDQVLGRMPLYSQPLSTSELENIKTWINNGAKDMFGNSPKFPNNEPQVSGYIAINSNFNYRFDTIRVGGIYYNSFLVPAGQTMNIAVGVSDDSTAVGSLINNKLKISLSEDAFSSPLATYSGSPFTVSGTTYWNFVINTSSLPQNQPIFMRYYTNDKSHTADTEFPTTNLIYQYKTYWSFIVKP